MGVFFWIDRDNPIAADNVVTTGPGGQTQVSYQWFDPELNTNIREEGPGGFMREMRNIKTGKQPVKLFTVPAGYEEISMP